MPKGNRARPAGHGATPISQSTNTHLPPATPSVNGIVILSRADLHAELDALRDEIGAARTLPKLLNRQELAQWLDVSVPVIKKLEAEGLPVIRLSEVNRYSVDAVQAWLSNRGAS